MRSDRSDASGTGYWSVITEAYRPELLECAFGRPLEVPAVLGPAAAAGQTVGGSLLDPGAGDNAAAAFWRGRRAG